MEERAWWTGIAVLGLGLAFAAVSTLLWVSGGRGYLLLKAKLRLGGLLLGLGAVAAGCFDKNDSAMVMCYDAGWDSDSQYDPDIQVDESTLDFGTIAVGDSAQLTLEISNNGASTLTIDSAVLADPSGPFATTFTGPENLAPGEALSLELTFTPVDHGAFEGTLTIASNDPDHPEVTVALQGEAIVP